MPMTTGMKKTADGVVFTVGVLKAFGWLLVASVAAIGYALRTSDLIFSALPVRQFYDTTAALRRDISIVAREAKEAGDRSTAVSCYIAKYPAGLCENVPRQPRRTP